MGEWCLEECCRFAPDTELEGGSKEDKRLRYVGRKGGGGVVLLTKRKDKTPKNKNAPS